MQWAGDRKGRPYESVTRSAVKRADVGIGPYESACRGGRPCPPGPDNAMSCRAGPVCPAGGCGKNPVRAVGEIGEALPVADEASRFRGSAPIGGHDSDRESVGTTVGNRRPLRKRILWCVGEGLCPSRGRPQGLPLRRDYKRRGEVRNPPFLRPFKIIFSSLLLSMQRMCFSGHR